MGAKRKRDMPPGAADLTDCDREPIHIPGRIQSFGALLAVSPDDKISHASANLEGFLGVAAAQALGRPLREVLAPAAAQTVLGRRAFLAGDGAERLFGVQAKEGGELHDLAIHLSGPSLIIEIERAGAAEGGGQLSLLGPMLRTNGEAEGIEELCRKAAEQLRALTGFDRVMVYEFAKDGSGHVLCEIREPHMPSYEGLHYPKTDIPQQARALYLRNLLRIISDVGDEGHAIVTTDPAAPPLDLSSSTTRAVSPIHIEYLRNMGVAASMSVSIVVRGELWGLFACHHDSPRILSYGVRTAAELFARLFAFQLDQKHSDLAHAEGRAAQRLHDSIMMRLAEGAPLEENVGAIIAAIGEVVPHDGAVGFIDGRYEAFGEAPNKEEFLALIPFLNEEAEGRVFQTDEIAALHPPAKEFASRAAGLLSLPVSRTPRDYIVLFRKEMARTVNWAGNPEKSVTTGGDGIRLSPRKSFAAWQETVRGTSLPWTEGEVRAAESLRITLLEVILRITDAAMRERTKAQEHQELLIAELNHRVRNILGLIKSLISQSATEAQSIADFTDVVGGRIHALARAHDQITKENWSPASAHHMIKTEIDAYLGRSGKGRIGICGPDVLLKPDAFTTLSLVVHELLTNATKYGALSHPAGRIDLVFDPRPDGPLEIVWKESGGPPISAPPQRRGFGTTIIERSIPYELRGKAEIRFDPSGLHARFVLPAKHVDGVLASAPAGGNAHEERGRYCKLSGEVLVVEDNMVIALDTEALMEKLGAGHVHVAGTVNEALGIAQDAPLSFALLDVNLAGQTSEPIAEILARRGVPFCFATGYGDRLTLSANFPRVPILPKPYDRARLEEAIADAMAG